MPPVEYQPDGRRAELFVADVESKSEYISKHVLKRTVDPRQRKEDQQLATTFAGTIRFFRGGRTKHGKRYTGDHYKSRPAPRLPRHDAIEVEALLDELDAKYSDLCADLDEDAVRGVVRNYLLKHLNAIMVERQSALYFVHRHRLPDLEKVLHGADGCPADLVPVSASPERGVLPADAYFENAVRDLQMKAGTRGARRLVDGLHADHHHVTATKDQTQRLGLAQERAAGPDGGLDLLGELVTPAGGVGA